MSTFKVEVSALIEVEVEAESEEQAIFEIQEQNLVDFNQEDYKYSAWKIGS